MLRHCHICRETYAPDCPACPACGAPADGVREIIMPDEPQPMSAQPVAMEEHANGSGPDIDLGSPVYQSPSATTGPLSGAAFVSWADRLNRMVKPLGSDGQRLPVPAEAADAEGAEGSAVIDLGSPVTDAASSPSGPPSGASFVAWSSLAERRKAQPEAAAPTVSEAARAQPMNSVTTSAPAPVQAAAPPRTDALRYLLLGVVIGVLATVLLWAVGLEPPQELRRLLSGPSPAQPADAP